MNTLDERLLTVMDVLHASLGLRHPASSYLLGQWFRARAVGGELPCRAAVLDFSADMAAAIDLLLQRYLGIFSRTAVTTSGGPSPKGVKKQVYLRLSGIQLAGRQMMMAEAVIDADTLYQESSSPPAIPRPACLTTRGDSRAATITSTCASVAVSRACPRSSPVRTRPSIVASPSGRGGGRGGVPHPEGDALVPVPVPPHPAGARILLTMRDITDRKLEELEHRHLAWHDSLTGLLQPLWADEILEAYCGMGAPLVFMDLDNFKLVNDNYGHKGGDRLLERVAGRLQADLPAGRGLARLGGDEFTALVPLSQASERAQEVADLMLPDEQAAAAERRARGHHRRQHRHRHLPGRCR